MLLSFEKNIIKEHLLTQKAKWSRLIGNEIYGKSIGILGMGSVGKQVAKRANAFGMNIFGFDKVEDPAFNSLYNIKFCNNLEKMVNKIDCLY